MSGEHGVHVTLKNEKYSNFRFRWTLSAGNGFNLLVTAFLRGFQLVLVPLESYLTKSK
jgi:hypothetical protein